MKSFGKKLFTLTKSLPPVILSTSQYLKNTLLRFDKNKKYLVENCGKTLVRVQDRVQELFEERDDDGEVIQQSSIWVKTTILSIMGTTIFGIGWLSIAKTDEVVIVSGKLEPLGSVQEIQMPRGGIASAILVEDGEEVTKGQVVMRLDAEAIQQRLKSLKESEKLKKRQLQLKQIELEQYLILNDEQQKMLYKNLELQKQIMSRYKILSEQGAAAELQFLQQLNTVSEIEAKITQARVDRQRQEAVLYQNVQQLKSNLEELATGITETSVNLRYQELKSPVSGIVFDLKPSGEGYVAKETETMMKIVPYDTLEARVEIPSKQIGFVRVGMQADLSIDSFPSTDFGILEGTVKSVGSDALPPSQVENRSEYRFPAVIQLKDQQLNLKSGKSLPLHVGMSLTSSIKLRKVSYLQLLLGTFQDKVSSLTEL